MARGARHRALDALLHRLRARAAARLLRLLPARQEKGVGEAAPRVASGPSSWREVRRTRGKRMAAGAHQVDEVLSRPGRLLAQHQEIFEDDQALVRSDG